MNCECNLSVAICQLQIGSCSQNRSLTTHNPPAPIADYKQLQITPPATRNTVKP
jgi:hypothetical protein